MNLIALSLSPFLNLIFSVRHLSSKLSGIEELIVFNVSSASFTWFACNNRLIKNICEFISLLFF